MVVLEDLKDLLMYKKQFFLPVNMKDKRHGSAIMLMTPNYQSSMLAMTEPYTLNRRTFESYYIEKTITRYIQQQTESVVEITDPGEYLFEVELTSKERKELDDSEFGIPEQRRYPLNDESHVLAAIRFFNHVEKEYEAELAKNIIKKIKEYDMADKVHVGDGNRFKPYWEKSGLANKSTNEAGQIVKSAPDPEEYKKTLINAVKDTLQLSGYKCGIHKDDRWGTDEFINGVNSLYIGRYDDTEIKDVVNQIKAVIGPGYKVYEDDFNSVFIGGPNKVMREFTEDEYFNEFNIKSFISGTAISSANKKMNKDYRLLTFTGYERDINIVQKYIDQEYIKVCMAKVKQKMPYDKINIICCGDGSKPEEFTPTSVLVYTPEAFKHAGGKFGYGDYIKYILQLYAVYCIKMPIVSKYERVLDSLAEPAAILFSGVAAKEIAKRTNDDQFTVERVFQYIIDKDGIDTLLKILRYNATAAVMKYAAEYGKIYYPINRSLFVEMTEENEEYIKSLQEDTTIPVSNPMPDSIRKLGNTAERIKRKLKSKTIYKLNKLKRDLEKGTGDSNNPGYTIQSLDVSIPTPSNGSSAPSESFSLSKLNLWSQGDYVNENGFVYLFEDSAKYDMQLRKALYRDRLKNDKAVIQLYKKVKADMPIIRYTFVKINRYNNRNLFYDLSYYNESFFRNMAMINDSDRKNIMRLFKTYIELMERLLNDDSLSGYSKKTVFIPVLDWRHNNSLKMWMYKEDINPISVIYYYMRNNPKELSKLFGDKDVVFLGAKNYFKVNFAKDDFSKSGNVTKFLNLIKRIVALGYNSPADPDPEGELEDSPKGIAMAIIDKVEQSKNVQINDISKLDNLSNDQNLYNDQPAKANMIPEETAVKKKVVDTAYKVSDDIVTTTYAANVKNKVVKVSVDRKTVTKEENKAATGVSNTKSANSTSSKEKKDAIVDSVAQAARNSDSVDTAMNKLDDDQQFKDMVNAIQNDDEENVRVDKTQASAVIAKQEEFHKKDVEGKSVQDLLNVDTAEKELPETKLKVSSINDDWQHMTFMNFDKDYDPDSDIVKMLDAMQHWTYPIAVTNVSVKDNSTSEDIVNLWTIECIDYKKTKFTLKVDIPKFINGSNFLKLRGNEKTLMIQSALLPIIKTGLGECQIIGSGGYNKIFVRRFGSRKGQSNAYANKLIRAISKYCDKHDDIKYVAGDNTKVCTKYELPIDYIDLAQVFNSIESAGLKIFFNQDELRSEYEVDDTKGIPIGVFTQFDSKDKTGKDVIIYYDGTSSPTLAGYITTLLFYRSQEFMEFYNSLKITGTRCTYSKASILNCEIPVILICSYLEGLIKTMNKAGIKYEFVQELNKDIKYSTYQDYIEFSDGYLVYEANYSSSMLMNGLKENDTSSYSIKDVNNRRMYLEFLETYTNSLNSDGLENSYDCMIDPITKEILERFKLPSDYVGILIHASNMLADNKYVRHIDQGGRRWRRKELIAGYFYKALTTSYQDYANQNRHTRKRTKMTIKQSAVIDLIVSKDPATSDLSINNALNDVECSNSVTNKGLVGMNVARGYTIATRGYDDSMLNLLGMDTGFSGNVGINRQATVNANIEGGRGFVKTIDGNTDKLSSAASFTMTEAVTPLGTTHDDPPRSLMTYVQTSKHMIRCDHNDPTLLTTGADEALPYLTSDIFAYKAKEDGKIVELVQEGFGKRNYIVVEYKSGKHEFINLSEEVKKNSDGGYYVPMKLDTDMSVGKTFKAGQILAYDKLSFSKSLGESGNLAANMGTLAKIAIINTDEGFEDSAMITESFANKLGTQVIQGIETRLDKGSNIQVSKYLGDQVMEGDTLFTFQADFDDEAMNSLLKNLAMDAGEISELGRNPVKSKYTGIVCDIQIYRTCDIDTCSESLRKFIGLYEKRVKDIKKVYDQYGIDSAILPKTGKVPEVGKTKNLDDSVLVIYYIKYTDTMSAGDKITFYSANKGIIKKIIPKDVEPYTAFRPNEHIDSFMSLSSISGRMTCSIPLFAATSKLMVELDRSVKDLAGIPYDESQL